MTDLSRPVDRHGPLRVEDGRLAGRHGEAVVLRGASLFWSQWMGRFWTPGTVATLSEDWGATVVRAAVGVDGTDSGYLVRPDAEWARLETVVEACLERGVYVVVDWHDHHAASHRAQARGFFERAARRWGHRPEVIWELWNEPIEEDWATVRDFAGEMLEVIRPRSRGVVVVGSPHWSQDVDLAAEDPLDDPQVAYALHFYGATHGAALRDKARWALDQGLALFATEWGASECTGDGRLDLDESEAWLDFLESRQVGWCNWSISDKRESSAALLPGASSEGGWSSEDLTPSGLHLRSLLRRSKA